MSRTKRDSLDTESMLSRLAYLLTQHAPADQPLWARRDAESLRRISMTLHRWFELECGDSDSWRSWCITRGDWKRYDRRAPRQPDGSHWPKEFVHDENGKPFMEVHRHRQTGSQPVDVAYNPIPDREAGARKRLAKILKRYPGLQAYVQTDPRGCALYILKPGDVPDGADVSSCYSRGLAVYR